MFLGVFCHKKKGSEGKQIGKKKQKNAVTSWWRILKKNGWRFFWNGDVRSHEITTLKS